MAATDKAREMHLSEEPTAQTTGGVRYRGNASTGAGAMPEGSFTDPVKIVDNDIQSNTSWGAHHAACMLAIGLFLAAAAVQFNDPDPVIWIIAYTLPAVLGALSLTDFQVAPGLAAPLLAISTAFEVFMLTYTLSSFASTDVSLSFDDEVMRELSGLTLAFAWLAYTFVYMSAPGKTGGAAAAAACVVASAGFAAWFLIDGGLMREASGMKA